MESVLTPEDATRFARTVGPDDALPAVFITPKSGNQPLQVSSLEQVESFLVGGAGVGDAVPSMHSRIHWIAPRVLASWVREIIGDSELATALDQVVASERPYGVISPEMKQLIAERIAEYRAVLDEQEPSAEQ